MINKIDYLEKIINNNIEYLIPQQKITIDIITFYTGCYYLGVFIGSAIKLFK